MDEATWNRDCFFGHHPHVANAGDERAEQWHEAGNNDTKGSEVTRELGRRETRDEENELSGKMWN